MVHQVVEFAYQKVNPFVFTVLAVSLVTPRDWHVSNLALPISLALSSLIALVYGICYAKQHGLLRIIFRWLVTVRDFLAVWVGRPFRRFVATGTGMFFLNISIILLAFSMWGMLKSVDVLEFLRVCWNFIISIPAYILDAPKLAEAIREWLRSTRLEPISKWLKEEFVDTVVGSAETHNFGSVLFHSILSLVSVCTMFFTAYRTWASATNVFWAFQLPVMAMAAIVVVDWMGFTNRFLVCGAIMFAREIFGSLDWDAIGEAFRSGYNQDNGQAGGGNGGSGEQGNRLVGRSPKRARGSDEQQPGKTTSS